MRIIGVNWDHPSGACLIEDGKIAGAVSEERFSRLKNDMSFPMESIKYCGSIGRKSDKIDGVGAATLDVSYKGQLYQYGTMSLEDMIREQHEVWMPRLYEGKVVDEAMVFKHLWKHNQYPREYWATYQPEKQDTFDKDRLQIIGDAIGIDKNKIIPVEHHLCHAYYGYYGSPFRNRNKVLVITVDGFGDGLNATVSIAENGEMKRIYATNKLILGRVYSHVTLTMGMKRLEHEYKVMGLAPYGKAKYAKAAYDVFKDILEIKGMEIEWKNKPRDYYFHFRDKLEGIRFDNIAAGMQMWVEDVLCQWVGNIVGETGIRSVVLSGGVSMNIKAMGKIAALSCINELFVCGSSSDDSCCVGAAIGAAIHYGESKSSIHMDSMYLGPEVAEDDAGSILAEAEGNGEFKVERNAGDERVAELLADGYVIGRCVGSMEFGQRALGNRSILADPTKSDIVPRINAMIKNRDFWMPFAPVVMDKYVHKYLINPKNIQSPYMTIGFETTEDGWRSMRAACHSADKSARAQILTKEINPELYSLLESFEKKTGRGALMNTSFNLHGFPIVNTAEQAYEVLLNSDLDGLLIPGGLIVRKKQKSH